MDIKESTSRTDRLTSLLFRLPAELRLEIYSHCLPENRHYLDVLADHPEIKWLGTSSAILQDAAPLLYGNICLYFDLTEPDACTRQGNIEQAFYSHIQATFEEEHDWTAKLIQSRLVKKIMIEVWCRNFDNIGDLVSWLTSTAVQLGRFAEMESLYVSLRDQYIGPKDESVLTFRSFQGDEERRDALERSPYLRQICWTMRRMKSELPRGCEVQWSLPGEVLPEVSFLRMNVPEQAPSEKERIISQFMGSVWRFVSMQQRELLLAE